MPPLQTRVDDLLRSTQLALDLAAPVEGAGAPLHHHHLVPSVATPTAHQPTAVDAQRGLVALPPMGAQDSVPQVLLTEAGRGLQVDQILRAWWLVFRIVRVQLEGVSEGETENDTKISILETPVGYSSEFWIELKMYRNEIRDDPYLLCLRPRRWPLRLGWPAWGKLLDLLGWLFSSRRLSGIWSFSMRSSSSP